MMKQHFECLAEYNQWMNRSIYSTCAQLPFNELQLDRGAFFKSIWGTLNHLAVADTLWLKRLSQAFPHWAVLSSMHLRPWPTALDAPLFVSFDALLQERIALDQCFIELTAALTEAELNQPFMFTTTKGVPFKKNLGAVLLHMFNHQTHHRGQLTTLLSQMAIDFGATDLLLLVPNLES
ncbi:MAG TPA: DinB family protein [Limnobacter sp.]|uniref:DinB family protein n=1 Tax=Limnobacter sp. TaxID=2003368 RepID=UPI002ED930E4